MQTQQKPIGILGGTFDPIHFGHLRLALELQDALDLANVQLIPSYQPVHRDLPSTTPEQRLAMLKLAIHNEPLLQANACEIERQTPSYTIDTLEQFRANYPQTPLCLLLGIDAFLDFLTWERPQDILKIAHVIVATRPNHEAPSHGAIAELIKKHQQDTIAYIHQNLAGGILLRSITALEISATAVRQQIANNRNPRYLLPDSVCDYIKEHGIYRTTRT